MTRGQLGATLCAPMLRLIDGAGAHAVAPDAEPRPHQPRLLADLADGPPIDFGLTFASIYPGRFDPCTHVTSSELWRASRTPDGPGTVHLYVEARRLWARAFGPGAGWLLEHAPRIASLCDRPEAFQPKCRKIRRLHRRTRGLRLAQTPTVLDALLPTIFEQRVKVYEARRSWARIVRALDERAPGPPSLRPIESIRSPRPGTSVSREGLGGEKASKPSRERRPADASRRQSPPELWLPPDPRRLIRAPSWWFAQNGVDEQRARAVVEVCRHATKIDAASADQLPHLFRSLRGVGPWTLGHVQLRAFGDPDALLLGDLHLPHTVTYFFTGVPRGSDARMLELLAPFVGQRGRALRWLGTSGQRAPRFGPKQRFRFTP